MKQTRNWIFLRGLARHSGQWGSFVDEFRKLFPQDHIEFLDLRGNGTLARSPSWLSIPDNVRDLRARSQLIQSGKPIYLMTISLGSMIGVEWTHRFPEEISGLVTINTSDRGTSRFFERMRPPNYKSFLKILTDPHNSPLVEEFSSSLFPHSQLDEKELATTRTNFIRQLIAAGTYRFPGKKPNSDILMLCSEGDLLVNPTCSRKIAQMWNLPLRSHPHGGHDLPVEQASWVCEEIQTWITSRPKYEPGYRNEGS